jgi:hypothetical protein
MEVENELFEFHYDNFDTIINIGLLTNFNQNINCSLLLLLLLLFLQYIYYNSNLF